MSKTILSVCYLVSVFLIIAGCQPSTDEVSASVRNSMQQTFDKEPQFRGLNSRVTKVVLIRDHDNSYQGIATVVSSGQSHDVSISVVADRDHTLWKAEPGALLALSLQEPQNSQSNETTSTNLASNAAAPTNSEISNLEESAIRHVKRRYMFRPEQPEEVREGNWYSSRMGLPNDQFVDVAVDYVVPSQGKGCRFIVIFPLSRRGIYSITLDDRAKQLFTEVPDGQDTGN